MSAVSIGTRLSGVNGKRIRLYTQNSRVALGGPPGGTQRNTAVVVCTESQGAGCCAGLSIQEQVRKSDDAAIGKQALGPVHKVHKPKYIRACQGKWWTVETFKKGNPLQKQFRCFECRSWRCGGECARKNSAQWYARIKTAFDRAPSNWVFMTLTLDQKDWKAAEGWTAEEVAFRESNKCWALLQDRLKYAFGKFKYVMTVEQHKKGWPHFHIAIQNDRIAAACALDGWREFRRDWLKPNSQACGFGRICHVELARDLGAISNYIVKCAGDPSALPGELVKESQLPVNAPKGFRRIRASKGFLPPKIKNTEVSGSLVMYERDAVAAKYEARMQLREEAAKVRRAKAAGCEVNQDTGEVAVDLLGVPLPSSGVNVPRFKKVGPMKRCAQSAEFVVTS